MVAHLSKNTSKKFCHGFLLNAQICFQEQWKLMLVLKFKNKFPNLYLEPMHYNNPDSKWKDVIPIHDN